MDKITVKHYQLVKPLGQGGSGITYLATDLNTSQKVVVKQFHRAAAGSHSWEREGEVLRTLRHDCIPKIVDSFIANVMMVPRPHLVQAYIDGTPLDQELKHQRGNIQDALNIGAEILDILSYLQSVQPAVIHRDIKPRNILRRQSDHKLCLIDFGSAISAQSRTFGHTLAVGTLGYQAPEQIAGEPVPGSDVYAVGVIMVECLTGIIPSKMLTGQTLNWRSKLTNMDSDVVNWLSQCLATDTAQRFQSAAEALDSLYRITPSLKRRPIAKPSFTPKATTSSFKETSSVKYNGNVTELQLDDLIEKLIQAFSIGDLALQDDILSTCRLHQSDHSITDQMLVIQSCVTITGGRPTLRKWLRSIEEKLTHPADMSMAVELWRLMGRPDLEAIAENRRDEWLKSEFHHMRKRFQAAGIQPNLPSPPYSIQELDDWRSLERRWLNRVDEILSPEVNIQKRIDSLKWLSRSIGPSAVHELQKKLTERINKSTELRDLATYFKSLGNIEMKDKLLLRRQDWLLKERDELQQRLSQIDVPFPVPGGQLNEIKINRFESQIVEQEKRHKQSQALDRELKRLKMAPKVWKKPYSSSELSIVQDEVEAHAHRVMSINRIQVEARRIDWNVDIPAPPYNSGLIEELDAELARQSNRHRVMTDVQNSALTAMDWAPSLPDAPYESHHPEEYKQSVDIQLEHHETIASMWRRLDHSGRQLIKLPSPPYTDSMVHDYLERSNPYLDGATARRELRRRRLTLFTLCLLFVATLTFLWQLSLHSRIKRLVAQASVFELPLPLVDVSCDGNQRLGESCIGAPTPTIPTLTATIDQFEKVLNQNINLKRRMDALINEASDLNIDVTKWRQPYFRDQLVNRQAQITKRKETQLKIESLRTRADALGMDPSQWATMGTDDDFTQLRLQITQSELLKSQVDDLTIQMDSMGLAIPKLKAPYRQSEITDLQLRVHAVSQIRTTLAKQSRSHFSGGLSLTDKWHFAPYPFEVLSNEVNQKLYMLVMGHNPSQNPCDDCPVERITFQEAAEFSNRLSWSTGLQECYDIQKDQILWNDVGTCTGWRLPTLSEWSYFSVKCQTGSKDDAANNNSSTCNAANAIESGVSEMIWHGANTADGNPVIRTPSQSATQLLAMGSCGLSKSTEDSRTKGTSYLSGTRDACIGLRLIRNLSKDQMTQRGLTVPKVPPLTEMNLILDADKQATKGFQLLDQGDIAGAHASFSMAQLSQSDHNGARYGLAKTLRLESEHEQNPSVVKSKRLMARDLLCQTINSTEETDSFHIKAKTELSLLQVTCLGGIE